MNEARVVCSKVDMRHQNFIFRAKTSYASFLLGLSKIWLHYLGKVQILMNRICRSEACSQDTENTEVSNDPGAAQQHFLTVLCMSHISAPAPTFNAKTEQLKELAWYPPLHCSFFAIPISMSNDLQETTTSLYRMYQQNRVPSSIPVISEGCANNPQSAARQQFSIFFFVVSFCRCGTCTCLP